jgi:hypothetical protein
MWKIYIYLGIEKMCKIYTYVGKSILEMWKIYIYLGMEKMCKIYTYVRVCKSIQEMWNIYIFGYRENV